MEALGLGECLVDIEDSNCEDMLRLIDRMWRGRFLLPRLNSQVAVELRTVWDVVCTLIGVTGGAISSVFRIECILPKGLYA